MSPTLDTVAALPVRKAGARWVPRWRHAHATRRRPPGAPTPIPITPQVTGIAVVALLVAVAGLLYAVPSLVVVLIGGAFIALLLAVPVRGLARLMPRGLALTVTVLLVLGAFALALSLVVPALAAQLRDLGSAGPELAARAEATARDELAWLDGRRLLPLDADTIIASSRQAIASWAEEQGRGLLRGKYSVFSLLLTAFGMAVVALYLLADARRVKARYLRLAPHRYRRDAAALWDDLHHSFGRVMGAQAVSMAIQGALAGLGLWLLGVPFPLPLGLWMALTALIPYLGAWLGAIPAILLALLVSPLTALLTALLYVGINTLEGNLLTPRLQGGAAGAPPVVVLLAVLGAGQRFGPVGAIVVVPALAFAAVLYTFFRVRLQVVPPRGSALPRQAAVTRSHAAIRADTPDP
jgi:predicted PurR-regulated permease PerM